MPKAKNTSPAAYVCRFKGGQFAYDGDEGLVKNSMGREKMKATNLEFKAVAKSKTGQFSANVGVHPQAKLGSYAVSDETLGHREIMKRYGAPIDSNYGAKVSPSSYPAKVGGGHSRKHQG
jgi:hypothetical protein